MTIRINGIDIVTALGYLVVFSVIAFGPLLFVVRSDDPYDGDLFGPAYAWLIGCIVTAMMLWGNFQ